MKRQIVLVQHCEAEHHVNGMVGSWTDTELTDFGRVQAYRVAARVSEIVGESENWKLVSSDLMRCAQTAEIVGEMISKHPILQAGLREYNLGEAVGKTVEWAQRNRKKEPTVPPGVDWRPFDGAETWREFYLRINDSMERLFAEESGSLIVVTHGGTCANVVAWWLRLPVEQLVGNFFGMKAGGISLLTTNSWNQHVLETFCNTTHLVGLRRE